MRLKSIVTLATFVFGTWTSAQAAVVVLVDSFSSPGMLVADTVIGGGGVSVGPAGPVNPPVNTLSRTLTHEWLGTAGQSNAAGENSSAAVDGNVLKILNESGHDSRVTVSWKLDVGFVDLTLPGPASFIFDVAPASEDWTVQLFYDNVLFGAQAFPAGAPGPTEFALTDPQRGAITNGAGSRELRLVFEGRPGFDLTIDDARFLVGSPSQVPEPSALSLVGLALVGAAWASRRRRVA